MITVSRHTHGDMVIPKEDYAVSYRLSPNVIEDKQRRYYCRNKLSSDTKNKQDSAELHHWYKCPIVCLLRTGTMADINYSKKKSQDEHEGQFRSVSPRVGKHNFHFWLGTNTEGCYHITSNKIYKQIISYQEITFVSKSVLTLYTRI